MSGASLMSPDPRPRRRGSPSCACRRRGRPSPTARAASCPRARARSPPTSRRGRGTGRPRSGGGRLFALPERTGSAGHAPGRLGRSGPPRQAVRQRRSAGGAGRHAVGRLFDGLTGDGRQGPIVDVPLEQERVARSGSALQPIARPEHPGDDGRRRSEAAAPQFHPSHPPAGLTPPPLSL